MEGDAANRNGGDAADRDGGDGGDAAAGPLAGREVVAYAPGRVNLIGDHTDYNAGVALPMAIDLGTTVSFRPDGSGRVRLRSASEPEPADVDLHQALSPEALQALRPSWARFVGAVVAVVRPETGGTGTVTTTLPVGAGLSSSAALEVATALAFGIEGDARTVAHACQRAEQAATGVRTGLMDQLVVSAARPGHALMIDFADLSTADVPVPADAEVIVVHSGESRSLDSSAYAERRAECEMAARGLGPLGQVDPAAADALPDPVLRRRARHVTTECARVRAFSLALSHRDLAEAGRIMTASHRSLAQDFEVSTPALDALVDHLCHRPGVHGARLTGAGFGGCVVALTEPDALDPGDFATPAWRVRPSGGASRRPR